MDRNITLGRKNYRAYVLHEPFEFKEAAQRLGVSGAAGRRRDRHGGQHATTLKQRAQPTGRASGVRCTPMLGGVVIAYAMSHAPGYTFCHAPAHVVSMRQTMTVPMRHSMSFAMRFPMRETMPFPMIMRLHV